MRAVSVFVVFVLFSFSCTSPPVVKASGGIFKTSINEVCIEDIRFYADKEFTKRAENHWYMENSRKEIRKIVHKSLPEYGFALTDCSNEAKYELHVVLDICVVPGLAVGLYARANVYYIHNKKDFLFEITGRAAAAPNEKSVIETQEKLGAEIVKKFAEKFGREKKN